MEGNKEIEECLVMLVPADFGVYVVIKVSGKMHENPLKRFIVDFHNYAMGADLENSLMELKRKVEKK
jgi:prefoldin subunit 5